MRHFVKCSSRHLRLYRLFCKAWDLSGLRYKISAEFLSYPSRLKVEGYKEHIRQVEISVIKCFICGEKGHYASADRDLEAQQFRGSSALLDVQHRDSSTTIASEQVVLYLHWHSLSLVFVVPVWKWARNLSCAARASSPPTRKESINWKCLKIC